MAQRRMFSLAITDSDPFQEMPLSTQALYFHLGMHADDDGFLGNARRIIRLVGASEDDFKLLGAKGFVLDMGSGIFVLRHWKMCNYIQKDRYRPTVYKSEKTRLFLLPDNTYSLIWQEGAKALLPPSEPPNKPPDEQEIPLSGACIHDVSSLDTDCTLSIGKDSLVKDRLELGKDRLNNVYGDGHPAATAKIVRNYLQNRDLDPSQFFGTDEELMKEVREITDSIFAIFGTRPATDTDAALVFQQITDYTPTPYDVNTAGRSISTNRSQLLFYAFEQAAKVGMHGNWNYIEGVLRNLAQRGITTLGDAEIYDDSRT